MENDDLPFSIREYKNPTGSTSWRVDGYLDGTRIRKNFADESEAKAFCDSKNADALNANVCTRLVQTRLTDEQVLAAEAAFARLENKASLNDAIDAWFHAQDNETPSKEVTPLLTQWLKLIENEVSKLRHDEIRYCCTRLVEAHPGLTTDQLTRPFIRRWIDEMDRAPATKRNNRSALHRFGAWLVESGYVKENPAAGIRIAKGPNLHHLPSVLTAEQASAFMQATLRADCRRLKGWATLCLFCGLRPSEALRLTWPEISINTAELTVHGLKRGSKPRIVKLSTTAVAWLKSVTADREEKPGFFTRQLLRTAVRAANSILPPDSMIVWDEDILRHSFASYTASNGIPVHELAEQMGNSPSTIYAHYRTPRTAAQVKTFFEVTPRCFMPNYNIG